MGQSVIKLWIKWSIETNMWAHRNWGQRKELEIKISTHFKYGSVIFLIKEGCLETKAFHSSWSILPSPFVSASPKVLCKKGKGKEKTLSLSFGQRRHEKKKLNRFRERSIFVSAPYLQLFRQLLLKVWDPIRAKVLIPSLLTAMRIISL